MKNEEDEVKFVDSTEEGDELPKKDQMKKLREELKVCRGEKEEYLTGWQRAKADYINLQKELEEVRISSSILTKEKMTDNLLPVLDSFDMAFSHKDSWEKLDAEWQKGIESIYQQLISSLSKSGIEKIDQINIPFDPNIHQSIQTTPTEDELKDHIVAQIIQNGYKMGDPSNSSGQARIIRPAKVVIYEYKKTE